MSKVEPVLKKLYDEKISKELAATFGFKNAHEIPRIVKVVINTGGGSKNDKQYLEDAVRDITLIAGQKPVVTKARISVSNFKLRQGMPVGVRVTLRGDNMWHFLLRLIHMSLPAIRDFRGVSNKFDGHGNYTLGIVDHTIFPEISGDSKHISLGMDISIVTTANTDNQGRELLKLIGVPFRKSTTGQEQAA
jgi:large subunit ribosomal protein L5